MNICIITSTFPTSTNDPIGGFILDFCIELSKYHPVSVITQRRSEVYDIDERINLNVFDWSGDKMPLSDLKFYNPFHIKHIFSLFKNGKKYLDEFYKSNTIDYTFALWAIPSGIAPYFLYKKNKSPYDIWCLGSDIWSHKENFLTKSLLKNILQNAKNVYADGFDFAKEIELFSNRTCDFLPSNRVIQTSKLVEIKKEDKIKFIFVGRYHFNKGPDILLEAIRLLPEQVQNKVEFDLYGVGKLKDQLENFITTNKLLNVSLYDILEKDDLFKTLSTSHFLIIPSRFDSIPVILSDALQCNIPIIGADIGDMGPLIKKYGIGFTFEKENIHDLATQIEVATYSDKSLYFEKIKKALEIFSIDQSVNLFLSKIVNDNN